MLRNVRSIYYKYLYSIFFKKTTWALDMQVLPKWTICVLEFHKIAEVKIRFFCYPIWNLYVRETKRIALFQLTETVTQSV